MKKYICGVLLSMTFLTSLMAGAKEPVMFERVIQLPHAELRFSMAEDFSRDMPAAPLVEKLTVDMLSGLKTPGDRFVIGRRWWDLKPPGWFKKPLGSMQMTISIGGGIDVGQLNFCKMTQSEFLIFYRESLVNKWKPHNEGIASADLLKFGVNVYPFFSGRGQEYIPYFEFKKNNKGIIWLSSGAGQDANMYYYFSAPVGAANFVEVEFIGAPDLNGSPYLFQNLVMERARLINESVLVAFGKENCLALGGGNWIEANSVELLKPDPSLLPKPIPVEEFLRKNGLKELPDTRELLEGSKNNLF